MAGDGHSGAIYWEGFDSHRVKMHELSKYAPVEVGDTIVSTGFSHFFPEDITIGYVEQLEVDEPTSSLKLVLGLAADMSRLQDVLLIKNIDIYELNALEEEANSLFQP